jgi:hypothetical protein
MLFARAKTIERNKVVGSGSSWSCDDLLRCPETDKRANQEIQGNRPVARFQSGFQRKRKGFMVRPGHSGMWGYSQETGRKRQYRRMSSMSSVFRVMTVAPTERAVRAIN